MKIFHKKDIENLHHLYRINLINNYFGHKSANLIDAQPKNGQADLAVFKLDIHLESNTSLLKFVTRPDSVLRHTFKNILETGVYTINYIYQGIIEEAHQTSAKYAKAVSEFDVMGLAAHFKNNFQVPFVKK